MDKDVSAGFVRSLTPDLISRGTTRFVNNTCLYRKLAWPSSPVAKGGFQNKFRVRAIAVPANTTRTQKQLTEVLEIAERAARRAGYVISKHAAYYGHDFGLASSKINNRDLVTVVDRTAEDLIKEEILRASWIDGSPTHDVLGEEEVCEVYGTDANASTRAVETFLRYSTADYKWICDPLDGTANFVSGIPICCVSIAIADRTGKLVGGVTYDPFQDEMFSASLGQGFRLNGKPRRVRRTFSLSDALAGCNFHADPIARDVSVRAFLEMQPTVRSMRITGSSALSLAWVAAGRLDTWWGNSLNCWDLSAGSILVKEAGGIVSEADGSAYSLATRTMIASSSPMLHREVVNRLRPVIHRKA